MEFYARNRSGTRCQNFRPFSDTARKMNGWGVFGQTFSEVKESVRMKTRRTRLEKEPDLKKKKHHLSIKDR
jgi:hypothetical protein